MTFYDQALDVMKKDNGILWTLLLCLIAAVFICFERLYHYHRCQINTSDFLKGVFNNLRGKNKIAETVGICDDTPGPISALCRSALLRSGLDREAVEQAIEETSLSEIPRLEKNLTILATIARIAPLLGLLGTVVGMTKAFYAIGEKSSIVNLSNLAPHIGGALITTAAGLTIAIPAHAFYNLLSSKVQNIVNEMEIASSELLYFLAHNELEDDIFEPQEHTSTWKSPDEV